MPLSRKKHFIFDMDGTLTVAVHDFARMRLELGLPAEKPILESIQDKPASQQRNLLRHLYELEVDYANQAQMQPKADELLAYLVEMNYSLGILTRNSAKLAEITLNACGLSSYFETKNIIGRENAKPKPDPEGIKILLQRWAADKAETVMIGDFFFDLSAGRAAGITTVHFDVSGEHRWPELMDLGVQRLDEIIDAVRGN